jgi:spore germination protein KC
MSFCRLVNKKVFTFLILIPLMLSLTGCWDRLELEEQAYVIAVGVDMAPDNKYSITYQIAGPGGGGLTNITGSSTQQPSSEEVTFIVPDLISARDLASASVTRRPSFSHTSNIIVSEEVARSSHFYELMSTAVRDRQIRRDSFLIISKEKAADFIRNNKPLLESRPQQFYEFMSRRWQETALVPRLSNLSRLLQRTKHGESLFLANYGATIASENKVGENENKYEAGQIQKGGGNPTEILGSCVIKDGVMIDTLDGEETRICQLLRPKNNVESIQISFQDPKEKENRVSTNLTKNYTKIDVDVKSDKLKIKVQVSVDIIILGIPSRVDYVQNSSNPKLLKASIQNELTQTSNALIKKTQQQYGKDPFNWSYVARTKFWTIEDYKNYGFAEKYKDADISVNYKVNIKGFGQQLSPP